MNDKRKEHCNVMVEALVGKVNADKWWSSPNKAFKNQTPFVQYELEPDIVKDYLIWHCYCAGG
jgi:hypothetical protein